MLTREDAITKARRFAKEITLLGISLDNVVLFGSYTKNNQREDSDIDIALVSSAFSGFGYEDRKLFSKINIRKEFLDIETKTYSTDYFLKGDPFVDEIKSTGIVIS
jgi:predicted nucleotidyltransferase